MAHAPSFIQREFAGEILRGRHPGMAAVAPTIEWRHVLQHPEVPDEWVPLITECMKRARQRTYLVQVFAKGWATESERRHVIEQLQETLTDLPYDCTAIPAHEAVLSDT